MAHIIVPISSNIDGRTLPKPPVDEPTPGTPPKDLGLQWDFPEPKDLGLQWDLPKPKDLGLQWDLPQDIANQPERQFSGIAASPQPGTPPQPPLGVMGSIKAGIKDFPKDALEGIKFTARLPNTMTDAVRGMGQGFAQKFGEVITPPGMNTPIGKQFNIPGVDLYAPPTSTAQGIGQDIGRGFGPLTDKESRMFANDPIMGTAMALGGAGLVVGPIRPAFQALGTLGKSKTVPWQIARETARTDKLMGVGTKQEQFAKIPLTDLRGSKANPSAIDQAAPSAIETAGQRPLEAAGAGDLLNVRTAPRMSPPPTSRMSPPPETLTTTAPKPFETATAGPLEVFGKSEVGGGNPFGLKNVTPGLTRIQSIENTVLETLGKISPQAKSRLNDPFVQSVLGERDRVMFNIKNVANSVATELDVKLSRAFKFNKKGGIPALEGIDSTIVGPPNIADVAARLPLFMDDLTPIQLRALEDVKNALSPFRNLLDDVGTTKLLTERNRAQYIAKGLGKKPSTKEYIVPKDPLGIGSRTDIMDGGFYIPRGIATEEGGAEVPIKLFGRPASSSKGFENTAVFNSQAEGVSAGWEYSTVGDVLRSHIEDMGNKATNIHMANVFRTAKDDATGAFLGTTAKMRLLENNPQIAKDLEIVKLNVQRLKSAGQRLNSRTQNTLDAFFEGDAASIDDLKAALDGIVISRGKNAGANIAAIERALAAAKKLLLKVRSDYNTALGAETVSSKGGRILHPGIEGLRFPDAIANAANKVLRDHGQIMGKGAPFVRAINAVNTLFRGLRATGDNSALAIQGLLGLGNNQRAYAQALRVNFHAWADKDALGAYLIDFNKRAISGQRLTSQQWAKEGLSIGGAETEFQLGQGVFAGIGKLPLIRNANRAFGYFGDSLRLEWADDILKVHMRSSGQTLQEAIQAGEVAQISRIANTMTGTGPTQFAGTWGDFALFAPRFFQSRIETAAKAIIGLRPGATLDQRVARNNMIRFIGWGTAFTVALNELAGEETDFRPTVDGKRNPNFMRVGFAGRDWSLFGTWDSLVGLFITAGTGDPLRAVRSLASPMAQMVWDQIYGRDFIGRETHPDVSLDKPLNMLKNNEDFGKWMISQAAPFSWQEIPEASMQIARGDVLPGLVTIGGDIPGIKSSPLSRADLAGSKTNRSSYIPVGERKVRR